MPCVPKFNNPYLLIVVGGASPDDETAAVGYSALTLALAGVALPLIFRPQNAAEYLLGVASLPTNVEQDRLMGMLASTLLAGGATAWSLKESAEERSLETATAERLQLGLMAFAAVAFGVHLYHGNDLTNNGLGAGAAVSALTFGVPAARMLGTERGRRRFGSRVKGFFDSAGRLFDFRRGFKLTTGLYAALTPIFFGAGLSYMFAPAWTLDRLLGFVIKGRDSQFIWRNLAGGLITILPTITYSLKEKADADELAENTPRMLNLALLAASAGHLAVLGPVWNDNAGGKYLPAMMGVWGAAGVAALAGLSSSATDRRV